MLVSAPCWITIREMTQCGETGRVMNMMLNLHENRKVLSCCELVKSLLTPFTPFTPFHNLMGNYLKVGSTRVEANLTLP